MARKKTVVEADAATGIAGLDNILAGGLQRNRLFLIEGHPGTGKTTTALSFLQAGASVGEQTLYVTLSETEEELRSTARAIEPFFTTKDVGKGSGLGLSQIFGLAKQSGGGVRIDTQLGKGTSVKVYLPQAAQMAAPPEATETRQEPAAVEGSISVLVVDDDNAVREMTRNMLADLGYEVEEAGSGGAALELLGRVRIDIALLDFAMPGMNGAELAKEIRKRRPHLPIVFATGYADASALMEESEDRIVQKPFDDRELSQKLSTALNRSRPELNPISPSHHRLGESP